MNRVMGPPEIEQGARLAALDAFAILDTPPERGFDDIVHLARRLCDVPVALVSLVDRDRQWFKARSGFPACETDLDRSVCKFVLAEADILQIPDLTCDPRTRENPLVTAEPYLRFYAGAPLRTPEGHTLGSLCVIDHAPRPDGLTPDQADDLRALARQVMDQLLLRRSLAELRKLAALVEQSRDFIGLAAPDGSVDFVNEAGRRLVGLPDLAAAQARRILDYFVPEEHARILAEVVPAAGRDGYWEGELHFRNFATGAAVPVHYNIFPLRDGAGGLLGYGTVTRDLTEKHRNRETLRASEASLRAVLDTVPVGILFAEAPSGRIVGGNRRLEEIFRHPVLPSPNADSYGEWVAFHGDGRRVEPYEYPLSRIIRGDAEHAALECRYQRGDGTRIWIEIVGVPMRDADGGLIGGVVAVADVDARRKAEEHRDLLNHELSHRMKNLLAMVQAIAASTLRGAADIDAAREVLGSRLVALGKAHDVLLGGAAESAPLSAVVREGVGVHEAAGERVAYAGPEIDIGGKAALSLALTLHELTTNAVKYGALSVPDGRVFLTASLVGPEAGPDLRIAWTERGGPPVVAPSRKGFGSRLIERGLTAQVGARLTLDYPSEGAACVIEAPLANFQSVE